MTLKQASNSTSLCAPLLQEPQLIQSLYGALVEKEGFHLFLELVLSSVNACAAELAVIKKQPLQLDHIWYAGLSQEFIDWYISNNMIASDLVSNHAVSCRPGLFQTALSLIEKVKDLPDYGRWQQDQNMIDSAWLVVDSTSSHTTLLAIQRTVEQGEYLQTELDQLDRLVPYIRQAVLLYQQLDKTIAPSETISGLINALPYPSFVLNERAELLYSNDKAKHFLKKQEQVSISNKRFQFQNSVHQAAFLSSSTQILRASMGQDVFDNDVIIFKHKDSRAFMMTLAPIEGSGILVTIYDSSQRSFPNSELIATYFGLTQAESILCSDLVLGMSLKEVAETRCKSEATIRSQLKQIFPKVGVNRQGQLICTVLMALMR
jgi:DNA-binding CsgD family transcriptional regulator